MLVTTNIKRSVDAKIIILGPNGLIHLTDSFPSDQEPAYRVTIVILNQAFLDSAPSRKLKYVETMVPGYNPKVIIEVRNI